MRVAERNIASAQSILDAIKQRLSAGTGNDLDVAQQESVLANQRALVPPLRQTLQQNINALATLVSRPPESINVTGGSLNRDRDPAGDAGPAVRTADAAAGHQAAGSAACVRHRQYRQCARAVLSEHQADRNGGYQSTALSSLFQPHAAFFSLVGSAAQVIFDGGAILGNFELTKAKQDELLQTYRKTVVSAFADVDNALTAIRETTDQAEAAGRRAGVLAAGLSVGRVTSCVRARPTS